jgi:hypothetical protein
MVSLTPEQRRELVDEKVPRAIDPETGQVYVLVREEAYQRMQQLLDDFQPADAYPAIDRAFAEGWEDPKMDDYDHYEERKP